MPTDLICQGVAHRFPNLKFGAVELGASWMPSWMHFMDASHDAFHESPVLRIVQWTEAQAVHCGDRPGAHRKDVS